MTDILVVLNWEQSSFPNSYNIISIISSVLNSNSFSFSFSVYPFCSYAYEAVVIDFCWRCSQSICFFLCWTWTSFYLKTITKREVVILSSLFCFSFVEFLFARFSWVKNLHFCLWESPINIDDGSNHFLCDITSLEKDFKSFQYFSTWHTFLWVCSSENTTIMARLGIHEHFLEMAPLYGADLSLKPFILPCFKKELLDDDLCGLMLM